jgi:hypothetical protein
MGVIRKSFGPSSTKKVRTARKKENIEVEGSMSEYVQTTQKK